MDKQLQEIRERILRELRETKSVQAIEQLRVQALGKKGELTGILRAWENCRRKNAP